MARIWAVCKDPGGTNGVLPVVKALRQREHDILLIVNGKARELLWHKEGAMPYASAESLLRDFSKRPDVCLTSMCSDGGVGRDLIPLLRGSCSTIALQDFWGGGLRNEWQDLRYRPGHITTNDKIGAEIIRQAWPEYPQENIAVTGFPALDKYAGNNLREKAEEAKRKLGLESNKLIILFGGQGPGTASAVSEVITALNEIGKDMYFIPRSHPRMKDNWPEEAGPWEKALASLKVGTLVRDTSAFDTPTLIAMSHLAVSMYSTILIEASALRKPNISVLYPEAQAEFEKDTGGMKDFPLVSLGCSAKATDRQELRLLLAKSLLFGDLGLEPAQEQFFRVDGKNASRVADFIESLIK